MAKPAALSDSSIVILSLNGQYRVSTVNNFSDLSRSNTERKEDRHFISLRLFENFKYSKILKDIESANKFSQKLLRNSENVANGIITVSPGRTWLGILEEALEQAMLEKIALATKDEIKAHEVVDMLSYYNKTIEDIRVEILKEVDSLDRED